MLIRIKLICGLVFGLRYAQAECGCSGLIVSLGFITIDFALTQCPDDEVIV